MVETESREGFGVVVAHHSGDSSSYTEAFVGMEFPHIPVGDPSHDSEEQDPGQKSEETSCSMPGAPGSGQQAKNEQDPQARQRHAAKMQKRGTTEKKCMCCGTQHTPVWRWGGDAKETLLCNACSLRIRRSNARPQHRTKALGERPLKKQHVSSSKIDGSNDQSSTEALSQKDIDALRQRLAGFMCQEKARLLGTVDSPQSDSDHSWDVQAGQTAASGWQKPRITVAPALSHLPEEWQTAPYPYPAPRPQPAAQWPAEPQPMPFPQIHEAVYWGQHSLHDQEMAQMYAQTSSLR